MDVVKNTSRNNPIGTAELLKIARSKREEMRGLLYFFVQGDKNRMARKKTNKYCRFDGKSKIMDTFCAYFCWTLKKKAPSQADHI